MGETLRVSRLHSVMDLQSILLVGRLKLQIGIGEL